LKAFDKELVIVGHPLNTHHFTLGMATLLGHDIVDFDKPLLMICERKMLG